MSCKSFCFPRSGWWLASAYSGNATNFVNVSNNGYTNNNNASNANRAPI